MIDFHTLLCILFSRNMEVSGQIKLSISRLENDKLSCFLYHVIQKLVCLTTGASPNLQLLLFKLVSLPNKSSLTLLPS